MRLTVYTIVAPRWRAGWRTTFGLGRRSPLRWRLVCEYCEPGTVWGVATVSRHWTWRDAHRARERHWYTEEARLAAEETQRAWAAFPRSAVMDPTLWSVAAPLRMPQVPAASESSHRR